MKNRILPTYSRVLIACSALLLFVSILLPVWRIELSAPQYPEGLVLQLYATKIAGDVDIINGLNHYIGMKTLHTEDFIEFKILPFILGLFGVFGLVTMYFAKRKLLFVLFGSFVIFGILAAVDFYRWNYDYGHNLDPNAAIRVPGMAYQPPLLGYKQLLNFGAYSIPDSGGWMLIATGLLLLVAVLKETALLSIFRKKTKALALLLLMFALFSCAGDKAVPIKLNSDNCDFCKMGIADGKCGAEIITRKGRVYKFDDISCMVHYCKENHDTEIKAHYIHDYNQKNTLILAETAYFISGTSVKTPMHGQVIGFSNPTEAKEFEARFNAKPIKWEQVLGK